MPREKRPHTLQGQMLGIVALGWLVPVALVLTVMGWYTMTSMGQRAAQSVEDQLTMNLNLSADRLDVALSASRTASTNSAIKDAWTAYERGGGYTALYRAASGFLDSQYRGDGRFTVAAFWFSWNPEGTQIGLYNESVGASTRRLDDFWREDFAAARAAAEGLDTGFAFLNIGDRVYLIRNVMASDFQVIGTLVLGIQTQYYFGEVTSIPALSDVTVRLNGQIVAGKGEPMEPPAGKGELTRRAEGREYALETTARLNEELINAQFTGYRYILAGMLAFIFPLLLLVLWFINRKVSAPIQALMEGAGHVEAGELGYQLPGKANSREFAYLTDSFNQMSGRLQSQFDRLYQEEVALRDAEIKALQSHINPHFLNNTLEIINWEARMSGNVKVSKMIEALSNLLDAALDRDKRPEVRLAEEMAYVNAYLYIVSERYGKRLSVTVELPVDIMDCTVPRLILQPVIENAVEHGIGPGGKGEVILRGRREGDFLLLEIENDGGLSREDEAHIAALLAPDYNPAREPARNIGIANINKRLRILYGDPCGLTIRREGDRRVVARLTIAQRAPEIGSDGHSPDI